MSRFRPVLALVLLAVMAGGLVVPEVHRAAHAAEGAAEEQAHVADHHADHDHSAPGVEAPCAPELAEPDCAVCAISATSLPPSATVAAYGTDAAARVHAEARALRVATASTGARGPPTA